DRAARPGRPGVLWAAGRRTDQLRPVPAGRAVGAGDGDSGALGLGATAPGQTDRWIRGVRWGAGPTGLELLLLAGDGDALRLGSGIRAGHPYGQHARVVRRRDRLAGDVRRKVERPAERPVA